MITITIKSELMEATRVFKKDKQSITYLKRVKKLHETASERYAGKKPLRRHYSRAVDFKGALKVWESNRVALPVKIVTVNSSQTELILN